jgi:hypothetical protein
MTLITTLTLTDETEAGARYAETPREDGPPVLGTLSVQKWALPKPTPSAIRVVLEFYEAAQPAPARPAPPRPSAAATRRTYAAEDVLQRGATVTIVKNRLSGIHQPPEWLEQYLGRTGKVLWTTAGGAMVKLDSEATWFPYAELEVGD